MAKTGRCFSDPGKWDENWFVNQTAEQKLLYLYLWDQCDHAGVAEIVPALIKAHTGIDNITEAVGSLVADSNKDKERISMHNGKLWFTGYIRFQQQKDRTRPLQPTKPFHKAVYTCVVENGLIEEIQKRDPVLLQHFESNTVDFSGTSNDKPIINQSSPNVVSKGKSIEGSMSTSDNMDIPQRNSGIINPNDFGKSFRK